MKPFLTACCLFISLSCFSQSYIKLTEKKNVSYKVILNDKEHIYVIGELFLNDTKDLIVIKTDLDKNIVWEKLITHKNTLVVNDAIIDSTNSNLVIAAEQYTEGNREALYALSLDPNGNEVFAFFDNEDGGEVEPYSIIQESDGYQISGFTKVKNQISNSFFPVYEEIKYSYLTKISKSGEKKWSVIFKENDQINSILKIKANASNKYLIGLNDTDKNSFYILKSISDTNYEVFKVNSEKPIFVSDIQLTDNQIIISGVIQNKGVDNYDMFVSKFDKNVGLNNAFKIKSENKDWLINCKEIDKNQMLVFGKSNLNEKKQIFQYTINERGNNTLNLFDGFQEVHLFDVTNIKGAFIGAGSAFEKSKIGVLYNFSSFEKTKEDVFSKESLNLSVERIDIFKTIDLNSFKN